MAFWGVEVKPGRSYTHPSNKTERLRLTQATLGLGVSTKKSVLQCNVGIKSPVLLCSLLPDKSEYCHLELEFHEEHEVVFSVIGPRSVHLTGYYLNNNHRHPGFDSSESFGEDIGHSDTEKSKGCSDEDDYDDSFINDGAVEALSPSPSFSSEEMEEEIMDDKESHKKRDPPRTKRLRKCQISDSEDDENINKQSVANDDVAVKLQESEDEEKGPLSPVTRRNETSNQEKLSTDEDNSKQSTEKSNGAHGDVDADRKREHGTGHTSVPATLEDQPAQQNEEKPKVEKRKERKRAKKGNAIGEKTIGKDDKLQVDETNEKCQEQAKDKIPDAYAPQSDERKPKRKKRKLEQSEGLISVEKQEVASKDGTMTIETEEPKSSNLRTISNGLIVEELKLGSPDGEIASVGRKVKIHFTGKLKEGGRIYETNIGSDPLKFRLGKGKTIQGLQLGLEGMRVGGKRQLTIPPELGYGGKGIEDSVPPNSWLELEVELVHVR